MTEEEQLVISAHVRDTPVRLGALAADLGVDVFRSSLEPGISGLIEPSEEARSGYRIKINRHESVERQRFTLAHELAHFLLHRDHIRSGIIDSTMYRSNLSSSHEVEANRLAAQIVMPDQAVKRLNRELADLPFDERVRQIAAALRVSEPAMRIKLGG